MSVDKMSIGDGNVVSGEVVSGNAIVPGKYQHYKGNFYEVYGTARHSETSEVLVVYRPLYGEGALWVRPLEMFKESVIKEGHKVPRFSLIEQ